MIRLDEHTYCLGFWFLAGERADWLGAVTSDDGGPLTLRYRFRYHDDPNQIRWWTATFPGKTEDEIASIVDDLLVDIQTREPGARRHRPWRRLVRGGRDRAVAALRGCRHLRLEELTETSISTTDN